MRNAGLEKAQAEIKIARRIINNLRYADDTTLMAESEEPQSFLMKVKEESGKILVVSLTGWVTSALIPVPPAFCLQLNPGQLTPHSVFPLTSQLT